MAQQAYFPSVAVRAEPIDRLRDDVQVTAADLLQVPKGAITERGLRHDLDVGIRYLESWLRGQGCVPIDDLMEDAATVEISRTQVWQWLHHGARLADGRAFDRALFAQLLDQEMRKVRAHAGETEWSRGHHAAAAKLFERMVLDDAFAEFLTLPAYEQLLATPD